MITDTQHGYGGRRLEGQNRPEHSILPIQHDTMQKKKTKPKQNKTKQDRNKTRLKIKPGFKHGQCSKRQKQTNKQAINRNSKLIFA